MEQEMDDEDAETFSWFESWWAELSTEERQEFRRLQSLIDDRIADEERAQRQTSTPASDTHSLGNQGRPSAVERHGYGSGRQKRDSLSSIVKQHGLMPLAHLIVKDNDSHSTRINGPAGAYTASKGQTPR
jgi:hypothetical protein